MQKKFFKQKIILFILVSMLSSVFMSCKEGGKDTKGLLDGLIPAAKSKDMQDGKPDEPLTKELLKSLYPDKEILAWVYNDAFIISNEVNYAVNDILAADGYDFVLFFQAIPESEFENEVNRMIADGEAPDILAASIGSVTETKSTGTIRAVENGWLEDLEEWFQTEDGMKLKEAFPEPIWKSVSINGRVYGISVFLYNTECVYYVNASLAEKYNISLETIKSKKITELSDLFKIVYEGEDKETMDLLLYSHTPLIDDYVPVFDPYNNACSGLMIDARMENGRIVNLYEESKASEYFHKIREYAGSGFLVTEQDRKMYKQSAENEKNLKYNFFIMPSTDTIFYENKNAVMERLKADYQLSKEIVQVVYDQSFISSQGNSVTGICSGSKNKELALKALTLSVTNKEITDLLLYGIEGKDYAATDDGKVRHDKINSAASLYFGNPFISTPLISEPDNKKEYAEEYMKHIPQPSSLGIWLDLRGLKEELRTLQKIADEYNGLFYGEYEDVDSVLLELNQRLKDAGIQEVMDEMNRQLDEMIKISKEG